MNFPFHCKNFFHCDEIIACLHVQLKKQFSPKITAISLNIEETVYSKNYCYQLQLYEIFLISLRIHHRGDRTDKFGKVPECWCDPNESENAEFQEDTKFMKRRGGKYEAIDTDPVLQTGGEPSTWFPPERLVHLAYSLLFLFLFYSSCSL